MRDIIHLALLGAALTVLTTASCQGPQEEVAAPAPSSSRSTPKAVDDDERDDDEISMDDDNEGGFSRPVLGGGSAAGATGTQGQTATTVVPSDELPAEKRTISFPGSRGDTVPGYLWLPKRKQGQKVPALIMMYGIKGNKNDGNIATAAQMLQADGFASLTLDWPGTGDRGSISNQDRIMSSDIMLWTIGDYGRAFDYLAAQPDVDAQRMGYIGASMGAMTGLAFASRDPRVKAMVAIVPIPDPLWGGDDPELTIGRVEPRPVQCISTDDNSDMSGMVCGNAGPNAERVALPGGHELEGFRDQVVQTIRPFVMKHLHP